MAGCEKCWRDAGYRAMSRMSDKAEEYHALLKEREDNPCSPEEQCGELHILLDFKDGTRRCMCGKVTEAVEGRE